MNTLKDDLINRAKAKIQHELTAIENRDDLTQAQKISQIIHIFSAICAGVAVQPIPFADIFLLTPIQAYMGVRLSAVMGQPLSERESTEIIKEIAGVVGLGLLAQATSIRSLQNLFALFGWTDHHPFGVWPNVCHWASHGAIFSSSRQKPKALVRGNQKAMDTIQKRRRTTRQAIRKQHQKNQFGLKNDYTHSLFGQKNMG
jgi:hypothetical protein